MRFRPPWQPKFKGPGSLVQLENWVPQTFSRLPSEFHRPGSLVSNFKINVLLGNGGMGDLICYLQPLKYIEIHWRHLEKTLYTFPYFVETARAYLDNSWTIVPTREDGQLVVPTSIPLLLPDVSGRVNLAGAHQLDFGFLMYLNMLPPEEWNQYPRAGNFAGFGSVVNKAAGIGKYIVLTPGARVGVRKIPTHIFNGIIDHVKSTGRTPVLIGKRSINKTDSGYDTGFDPDYNYKECFDLTDQTEILEAMKVMDGADAVVGLDNGLLHVAGCTDTPIVFGYTVAAPEHRRPRRPSGRVYDVTPNIACMYCQSRFRMIANVDLTGRCLYDDMACLETLTVEKWKSGINCALSSTDQPDTANGNEEPRRETSDESQS